MQGKNAAASHEAVSSLTAANEPSSGEREMFLLPIEDVCALAQIEGREYREVRETALVELGKRMGANGETKASVERGRKVLKLLSMQV